MEITYQEAYCIVEMVSEMWFGTSEGLPQAHMKLAQDILGWFPDLADVFQPLFLSLQ